MNRCAASAVVMRGLPAVLIAGSLAAACLTAGACFGAEPTALESFVANPNVVLAYSESVGSIASSDATLEVTALVAEDTADVSRRMRGVKLSLQDNGGSDHLWLDVSQLAAAQGELAEIESGIADLKRSDSAPWRAQGTGRCWMPAHPERILCPGFLVGPDGSRLTLGAYGSDSFEFPARRPAELAALFARAIEAFSAH